MKQNIYEINTRVWLKRFSNGNGRARLKDVPKDYWLKLKELGIDLVWLMGIWKTNEESIEVYCFDENLVNEYSKTLKDFKREDVIGSPYSIDSYEINPQLGTEQDLLELKEYLNSLNIKLILDFIPNHFSVYSKYVKENPGFFLTVNEDFYNRDSHTYFRSVFDNKIFLAHGRDPFFPAWQDTVQLNHFSDETRKFMINNLVKISKFCDGVRCDMAMLVLNNVFDNTWSGVLTNWNYSKPQEEFWQQAIPEIRKINEDFIFIAETYWDLEWELQKLGFDFTYDKKLFDRLNAGNVYEIKGHLTAENDYQNKSVRFIENHDEQRVIKLFEIEKAKAAAVIISTITGLTFYHDGQFEGKKIKMPVQLGREPKEKVNQLMVDFYHHLLTITNSDIFKKGDWQMLESLPASDNNLKYNNILAWVFNYEGKNRLVAVNYSKEVSQCKIKLNLSNYPEKFKLKDLLNFKKYYRKTDDVKKDGLFIELGPYKSHIFSY